MHPTKSKIVYCKDGKRKGTYPNIHFDFLGYRFRPRLVRRSRDNTLFWGFTRRSARVGMAPLFFPDNAGFESLALVKPYNAANAQRPALATATELEVSGNGPFNNGEMK
jgi:hypothetical protein